MSEQQNKFEGWAIVELFGHQREAGYVSTEAFGQAVMFRVDVPEIAESPEAVTEVPTWIDSGFVPAGSIVRRSGLAGRTRLIGPGAVYAINPCSEEAARKAIVQQTPRPLQVIKLAETPAIEPPQVVNDDPQNYPVPLPDDIPF